jgi:hypothetical protein
MGFLLLLTRGCGRDARSSLRLTAVLRQEIEDGLHARVVGRVQDRPPEAPPCHEAGAAQVGQVKRQGRGRDPESRTDLPGRKPQRALAYQDPEELQPGRLGESGEGVDGRLQFHASRNIEM